MADTKHHEQDLVLVGEFPLFLFPVTQQSLNIENYVCLTNKVENTPNDVANKSF